MGMALHDMRQQMTADPALLEGQCLPGAHLPMKGFYFTKNLPETFSSATPRTPGRLLSGGFLKPVRASPALETASKVSAADSAQTSTPQLDGA